MKINRRDFIKSGAVAVGAGIAGSILDPLNALAARSGSAAASERVIVIINLYGGNDGLNTLIPLNQYDRYKSLRPSLAVEKSAALTLSNAPDFGFHPRMTGLHELYAQNKVAVINGVGVPKTARGLFDHAAGQYEFQSCDIQYDTTKPPTGWLGRYLDSVGDGPISPGVDMGGGKLILTGSRRIPVSISTIEEFQLKFSFDENERLSSYKSIMKSGYPGSVAGETNRKLRSLALQQSSIVQSRTRGYTPMATYPVDSYLGYQLMQCAQLISADLGVRALAVGYGDFDTHFGQLGPHDNLLQELSDSISAFYQDLQAHGVSDRVLILTISEFGRRAYQNNDIGTDHGLASIAIAVGDSVNPGIYGDYPALDDAHLVFDGNLDVHVDFRSVYSTAIAKFLKGDPERAVGGKFPLLNFL